MRRENSAVIAVILGLGTLCEGAVIHPSRMPSMHGVRQEGSWIPSGKGNRPFVPMLRLAGGGKLEDDGVEQLPGGGEGMLDLSGDGGVLKRINVAGYMSPILSKGDEISISVVGRVVKSGEVFLNRTNNDPLIFRFGMGEVVPGLEMGVASMKQGEEASLIVRGDAEYGYGEEPPWRVIPPRADIEFTVELQCWGERDLTDGQGQVMLKVIRHDREFEFEQPGKDDEVLIEVSGERTRDGMLTAAPEGPSWIKLSEGLIPRGLALAICELRSGMTANVTLIGSWAFTMRQLDTAGEEMLDEDDKKAEKTPFFHPNQTAFLRSRSDRQFLVGVASMTRGDVFRYTVTLHNFHSFSYVTPDRELAVKLMDQGVQDFHLSDVSDGDDVDVYVEAWIPKDGFREDKTEVLPRNKYSITVGDGTVPRGLDLALRSLRVKQRSRVIMPTTRYARPMLNQTQFEPLFTLPETTGVEIDVEILNKTIAKARRPGKLLESAARRREQGNALFRADEIFDAVTKYEQGLALVDAARGMPKLVRRSRKKKRAGGSSPHFDDGEGKESEEERERRGVGGEGKGKGKIQEEDVGGEDEREVAATTLTTGMDSSTAGGTGATGGLEWQALAVGLNLNVASCRIRQEKYEDAREAAETALAIEPNSAKGHLRLGEAFFGLGDFEACLREMEDAKRADPHGPVGRAAAGVIQAVKEEKLARDRQDRGLYAKMFG